MHKHLILCSLFCLGTSLCLPSFANEPSGPPPNGMMGMGGEHRGGKMREIMSELRDALRLSKQQEEAWKLFVNEMKPKTKEQQDPEALKNLKAPERMQKMAEHMKQRADDMNQKVAVVRKFYNQLSADQQKVFDEKFMPNPRGGMMGKGMPPNGPMGAGGNPPPR